MTFYAEVIGARNELVARLGEISWLSGKVYENEWRTDSVFPIAMIQWDSCNMELENINNPTYKINSVFNLYFRNNISTVSGDYDLIVSGVGAMVDKIKAFTVNYSGGVYWETANITDIDYTYASPGAPGYVLGERKITVTLTKEW